MSRSTILLLTVWHTVICMRRVLRRVPVEQVCHDRPDWFVRGTADVPLKHARTPLGLALLSAARYEWAMRQVVRTLAETAFKIYQAKR
jgi:hypothetical protein